MLRPALCIALLYLLPLPAFAQAPAPAPAPASGLGQAVEHGTCGGAPASDQFKIWVTDFDGSTGMVKINGVDARHPSIPFTWVWGDGTVTEGWFPQSHTYVDLERSYVVQVHSHAHESDKSGDCTQLTLPIRGWIASAKDSGKDGGKDRGTVTLGRGAAPNAPVINAGPKAPPKPRPEKIRVGGRVAERNLVSVVAPEYPEVAKAAHAPGTVLFRAVIGKDGTIQELEYISGPPDLMDPALKAVRQWRYKPTLLNGYPVEVDTTISVVYSADGWVDPRNGEIDPTKTVTPAEKAAPVDPKLR